MIAPVEQLKKEESEKQHYIQEKLPLWHLVNDQVTKIPVYNGHT
jgi:hypothetical protein